MSDDEELRATEYRRDKRTQLANRRGLAAELVGSPLVRMELAEAWSPLIAAQIPIPDVKSIEDDLDEGEER